MEMSPIYYGNQASGGNQDNSTRHIQQTGSSSSYVENAQNVILINQPTIYVLQQGGAVESQSRDRELPKHDLSPVPHDDSTGGMERDRKNVSTSGPPMEQPRPCQPDVSSDPVRGVTCLVKCSNSFSCVPGRAISIDACRYLLTWQPD